jgi:pyridoxal 5'-phosphate synthase pdxT subunit
MVEKTVGVLALQGAFEKHAQMLQMLGVKARYVRRPCDLINCEALIIPGGESTTMRHHLRHTALLEPLKKFANSFPVFGTCAGLILMANDLELLDMDVSRNGFGPQIASFSAPLESELFHQYQGVFIRAPRIMGYREGIAVLASYRGEAVLVQKGPYLAASFHPELTEDPAIHRYFIDHIV